MHIHLSSLATAFAIFSGTFATLQLETRATAPCLNATTASQVANNFRDLIVGYNATFANQVLASNYTDYTDSVSELINSGCPNGPHALGSATYTSRAAFEADQATQPSIPFNILQIWYNCETVFVRWNTPSPGTVTPEEEVTGIIVMQTFYNATNTAEPFQIDLVYSEFNSGAWLYDLGVFVPNCSATTSTASSRPATSTKTSTVTSTATSIKASTVTATVTSVVTSTVVSTAKTTKTTTVTTSVVPTTVFSTTASPTATVSDIWSICVYF